MGKTPKPLLLLIHPSLEGEKFFKMREQGHVVHTMGHPDDHPYYELTAYDMILGPNAWNMVDVVYLDLAIKASRLKRYPGGKTKKATKKHKAKG